MTFLTIGHRGVMGVEPENTLRSYLRAERSGMDGIALDLRLSKDGVLVAVHDPEVDRTTDGSGAVADLTLAELRGLDAGQGERVPVFEEVLDAVRSPLQVSVEDRATAGALAELVLRRDLVSRVEIASTDEAVLAEAARRVPGVRTALFVESLGAAEAVVSRAPAAGAGAGAATIALDIHRIALETVEAAHAAGLRMTGLAVNTLDQLRLARALGLDGVTTDFPEIRSTGRFTA
ncbi:glycerophosphodiester phosphodiesterase [Streptomyces yangpuensis]|uniref:glycerophosphodiester phosphodiesterase n=1 Tax=Streptomyces yangpuensis TaxID=1648182 RepID=UPI00365C9C24